MMTYDGVPILESRGTASIKQVLNEAPHASEAYISVESRAPMILRTFADDPQACFFV